METRKKSLSARLIERIFPKTPDFYLLLQQQCEQVCISIDNLVDFIVVEDPLAGKLLKEDEHEADRIRVRILHELNSAFSTPIDREDIYRAIASMDSIVTYCKSTYNEMKVLGLTPDKYSKKMVAELQTGVHALRQGFDCLGSQPEAVERHAFTARHSERRIEKMYRKAIAELFQGEDYLNMFKRRELYRHLSNAGDKIHETANVLQDIAVKIT
ncbi:MAG: DUF47 domain-containing protein [Gammaproteobacteria bacterium]